MRVKRNESKVKEIGEKRRKVRVADVLKNKFHYDDDELIYMTTSGCDFLDDKSLKDIS